MLTLVANIECRLNGDENFLERFGDCVIVHVCEDPGIDPMASRKLTYFIDLGIAWQVEREVIQKHLALVIRHGIESRAVDIRGIILMMLVILMPMLMELNLLLRDHCMEWVLMIACLVFLWCFVGEWNLRQSDQAIILLFFILLL